MLDAKSSAKIGFIFCLPVSVCSRKRSAREVTVARLHDDSMRFVVHDFTPGVEMLKTNARFSI